MQEDTSSLRPAPTGSLVTFARALVLAAVLGCGTLIGGEAGSALAAPDTDAVPAERGQSAPDTVVVPIEGSQLAYEKEEITATAGTELVIRLVNDGSMPHNLVLVRSDNAINPVGIAALDAADNEYIPESEMKRILGYTAMADPGETVELQITVPAPGEHPYICTFPGHFRSMQGVLISEE